MLCQMSLECSVNVIDATEFIVLLLVLASFLYGSDGTHHLYDGFMDHAHLLPPRVVVACRVNSLLPAILLILGRSITTALDLVYLVCDDVAERTHQLLGVIQNVLLRLKQCSIEVVCFRCHRIDKEFSDSQHERDVSLPSLIFQTDPVMVLQDGSDCLMKHNSCR